MGDGSGPGKVLRTTATPALGEEGIRGKKGKEEDSGEDRKKKGKKREKNREEDGEAGRKLAPKERE